MAGTGKSQVIKALIHFFKERKEEYRFIVLAPTGSAAALVNGFTYHSVLGIRDASEESVSSRSLVQIKDRLLGVSYIFIDEVSMMSCQDLYKISARRAKTFHNTEDPFGGINIIFAGDFAQLPPAMNNAPLYSAMVKNRVDSSMTIKGQENAIGKALWLQVTEVVILRKNMRQKSQTEEDAKLRKCLENMRYSACTEEDIEFLNSLVAGRGTERKKINQEKFRNVSVITAQDTLNDLGAKRFALETDQTLHEFHSIDKAVILDPTKNKNKTSGRKAVSHAPLHPFDQNILWHLPPALSQQRAGILQICKGMPVMIKRNEATECCVKNGAEAIVYDWTYTLIPGGKRALSVLFVELKNPPQNIQLDGLPLNVVPLKRNGLKTECMMPNGKKMNIFREQVSVLLNFGMSDYASQGRTCPNNPIDLQNCRSHQSYYTALSRSSSAEGTIILQGFDASRINNPANLSGYLRQEFRELEILDEITKLRFEGNLPDNVDSKRRYGLLNQFKKWKGDLYEPANIHPALSWKKNLEICNEDPVDWKLLEHGAKQKEAKTSQSHIKNKSDTVAKQPTSGFFTKKNHDIDNKTLETQTAKKKRI